MRGAGVRLPPLSPTKKKNSKPKEDLVGHQPEDQLTPTDSDYIALVSSKQNYQEEPGIVIKNEVADHGPVSERSSPLLQVRPLSGPKTESSEANTDEAAENGERELEGSGEITAEAAKNGEGQLDGSREITDTAVDGPRVQAWTPSASVYDSDELEEALVKGADDRHSGETAGVERNDEQGARENEEKINLSRRKSSLLRGKKFKFAVTKVVLNRM